MLQILITPTAKLTHKIFSNISRLVIVTVVTTRLNYFNKLLQITDRANSANSFMIYTTMITYYYSKIDFNLTFSKYCSNYLKYRELIYNNFKV